MNNVMVDIETLGTSAGAAIVSIGAVKFDESGLGETYYSRIDLDSCLKAGLFVEASTLEWWLGQGDAARAAIGGGSHLKTPLKEALLDFKDWLGGRPLWGNGAAFDNALLRAACRLAGVVPWSHRQDVCYRTLKRLAPHVERPERVGVYHNALDDARTQALHAVEILRSLRQKREAL